MALARARSAITCLLVHRSTESLISAITFAAAEVASAGFRRADSALSDVLVGFYHSIASAYLGFGEVLALVDECCVCLHVLDRQCNLRLLLHKKLRVTFGGKACILYYLSCVENISG